MLRQNDIIVNNSVNDVKYVISQLLMEENGYCELRAKLSDDSIHYLRNISKIGSTLNSNGSITQKELAGRLIAGKIEKNLTYHLDVDRNSIISGKEQGVKIVGGLYNFHSHPQEAYKSNNVNIGWPSSQDYVGFLYSAITHNTILHIVGSLEGIYIISLTKYWASKKEILNSNKYVYSFILDNYSFSYKKKLTTINWYVRTVNRIEFEDFPLFIVQFFSWKKANSSFIVNYSKNGENCFVRQSTEEKYKYLHN
jgi:hypothetical protein